mgnify:CR=1 FL=1
MVSSFYGFTIRIAYSAHMYMLIDGIKRLKDFILYEWFIADLLCMC